MMKKEMKKKKERNIAEMEGKASKVSKKERVVRWREEGRKEFRMKEVKTNE